MNPSRGIIKSTEKILKFKKYAKKLICAKCKKEIKKGSYFVIEGKYPGRFSIAWNTYWLSLCTTAIKPAGPEVFGRIYHKKCYIKK